MLRSIAGPKKLLLELLQEHQPDVNTPTPKVFN